MARKTAKPPAPRTRSAAGDGAPPSRPAPPAGKRFVHTTVDVEGREEVKIVELPAFEPPPWGSDAELGIVGARVSRRDGEEKVTGRARYTSDIVRPRMLHAAILRAPVASGRITRMDLDAARGIAGVHAVIGRDDIPELRVAGFPLLDRDIHYAGQPLAALCADSPELAAHALGVIVLEIERTAHAVTAEDALAPSAPCVRGTANRTEDSPVRSERGDVARGLADADVTITREYRTPVALHSALEPHGSVAEWQGDRLTVWESTQGIFRVRSDLATALGLPLNNVRVLKEYMGGGFGAKNGAGAHCYLAALLARHVGRPVRCMVDREGEQMDTGNRPATIQKVTLGATRDGRLTAIVLDAVVALGIGGWEGGPAGIYRELYRCPNVRTSETFAYINASAMSAFRAPGHAEGAFGLERAMDTLAAELGMDPLELRRANYAGHDQAKGRPYTSKRLDECYRAGAERFGWGQRDRGGKARHGSRVRGFGMASQIWNAGGGPPAYALVRVNGDGSIDVITGSQDLGTGTRTIFAQIAAEAIGASLSHVRVLLGDTEAPFTSNSWGSITTASVGPAVRMAAMDARGQMLEAAAGILGKGVEMEQLDARDSVIHVRGQDHRITFAELGEELGDVMIIGRGSRGPNPDGSTIACFSAHFVEVEVDLETGVVRVLRHVAAHDSGRIINPTLAESQLEGGIIQGLGYALFEERVMDRRLGIPVNPTLHDYKIPTMRDIPAIDAFCLDVPDAVANHTGAKGLSEPPLIPTAPAIANAVADALGVEVNEIPLTPWRVLGARGV
ncbi:MAG: xanthine dehydrogenase family protein molybdopterin-binding subunit [Gemmatimonadota bacterium]|nr:xanthine dehydrogenase family protein molybdopterin-binding subunit [Gemmatimonadota bacterium]